MVDAAGTNYIYVIYLVALCAQSVCSEECRDALKDLEFTYHNYTTMTEFLNKFTTCNNNLTTLYSIGKSVQKRDLWVVKITAMSSNAKNVQNIKLMANIHGNEAAGREILLHFMNYLIRSYWEGSEVVKHLLETNVIHIIPSINPDGFEHAKEGVCIRGPGRLNARGTDLNRSFPDYFRRNPVPVQPETRALVKWMSKINFILSASLHGGAMVANYPFESTKEDLTNQETPESKSPDDDVFRYLALVYSKNHPIMHLGTACDDGVKFPNGITNGAAWYPLTGGMQDYNYAKHGCMEVTLEVSCCKYPMASELKSIWNQNKDALIQYCLQSGMGVKGTVKNTYTLDPISKANLTIEGRNMTFTTSDEGEFLRILLPGSYKLKIQVTNYKYKSVPFKVEDIKSGEFQKMTVLDVFLTPGCGNEDEDLTTTEVTQPSTTGSTKVPEEVQTSIIVPLDKEKSYISSTSESNILFNMKLLLIHVNIWRLLLQNYLVYC